MQITCTICDKQGNLWQDLETICVTKCGHIFHLSCLKPRFCSQSKSTIACPISTCNKKVKEATIIQIDCTVKESQRSNEQNNTFFCCVLCHDPVKDPENISVTKCGHVYHHACLRTLISQKSYECLLDSCRTRITPAAFIKMQLSPVIKEIPETKETLTSTELQRLLEGKEDPSQQTNEQQDIKECLVNTNKTVRLKNNEITQNQELENMKQKYEALEKKMEALEKDRSDAKKDVAIWEMSFKYLQDRYQDTDMMIPNEKALDLIKENVEMKMYVEELERERNNAKKESTIWEMSFSYLQENFKDTDLMIPDAKTLQIIKENETMKICIQDLSRELITAKKDVTSAKSLRADFENYIEENLNMKNDNEIMRSDLEALKDQMTKVDMTITELVLRHSHESDISNELNESLLKENSRLSKSNDTLQIENNKLQELKETLQTKNNKLYEINRILQKENDKRHEANKFLIRENSRLKICYIQNETRHLQWGVINRRRSYDDSLRGTRKKRCSDTSNTVLEKQVNIGPVNVGTEQESGEKLVINIVKTEAIKEQPREVQPIIDILNKKAEQQSDENRTIIDTVNTEAIIKKELPEFRPIENLVTRMAVQLDAINEEPDVKRIKLNLDDDIDESASISSSTKIRQAIQEIEETLNFED